MRSVSTFFVLVPSQHYPLFQHDFTSTGRQAHAMTQYPLGMKYPQSLKRKAQLLTARLLHAKFAQEMSSLGKDRGRRLNLRLIDELTFSTLDFIRQSFE